MQPLGKQPLYRPAPSSDEALTAEAASLRAPASAVNAIMGRLGLARTQDEPEANEALLTSNLADPSWAVRVSAVQKLGKMGKQAPLGLLLAAMRDEQSGVRAAAARALSRNPRQAAISALVAALEDPVWLVRSEAALALGAMCDLAPLEPLLVALKDADATVRASVARALGETHSEKALEPLNMALQDEDWSVREAAALALAQLELEGQSTVPPLLNARMDRDPAVRDAAEAGFLQIYPEMVSTPPPPSDSLAHWLERIDFPHSALLEQAQKASLAAKGKRNLADTRRMHRKQDKKSRSASFKWSYKAMNAAEGVLAAVIITSLFIVWLAIETQPRSTQGQASPSNTHGITLTTYRQHDSSVAKLAWSPDGQNIASADVRGTVLIWQASTGKTLTPPYAQRGMVLAITWTNPSTVQVVYSEPNKSIQVIELILSFGTLIQTNFQQTNLPGVPTIAAWSADKQMLAFDTGDGSIQIWNVTTDQKISTIQEKHALYNELAWSPNDAQIATLSNTGLLETWNTWTGQQITSLTSNHFATIAAWISCGHDQSGLLLVDANSTLIEWSYGRKGQTIETYLAAQSYNFSNTDGLFVSDLAISPDQKQVLVATSDGPVQIRDIQSGNLIYLYTGHSDQVNDIEWSPNSQHIATASMDTTVQVWQEPQVA